MTPVRRYSEMKDSGIPWIGMIPKHWNIMTIKYTSWLKGRIGWQGLKSDEFIDNGPYLITGTDFEDGKINWETCVHITEERYEEDQDIHIFENDLLITKDGTIGKVAIVKDCPDKVSLNSGVLLIRNTKILYDVKYLYYVLCSEEFHLWYEYNQPQNSTIRHLYQGQFYNFKFCFPSLEEQSAIAAYLDEKCSKIDEIIASAKASIEDYKQWKASIIYEAVTKGLDPDAEMKESGIDIIGKIPKKWTIRRLRFLCSISTGNQDTQNSDPYGIYPFYVRSPKIEYSNNYTFEGESILMAGDGVGAGKVFHHACGKYAIHQRVYYFYGFKDINSKYLYYFMSNLFSAEIDKGSAKSTVPSVRLPMLQNFHICLPTESEQYSIAEYLDKKNVEIDKIIEEKQSLITDLESYKKSLIYEVVTGKRRVY